MATKYGIEVETMHQRFFMIKFENTNENDKFLSFHHKHKTYNIRKLAYSCIALTPASTAALSSFQACAPKSSLLISGVIL